MASQMPQGWMQQHSKFIQDLAGQGEEIESILLLFETEFPELRGLTTEHVQSTCDLVDDRKRNE